MHIINQNKPPKLPKVLLSTSYLESPRFVYHRCEDMILEGFGSNFIADKLVQQTNAVDMFRNDAVRFALENGYDYVFFADSDMSFPQGVVKRLIALMNDHPEHYIASGLYTVRQESFAHAVYKWNGVAFTNVTGDDPEFKFDSVFEADGVGTGCMLIRTSLFRDKLIDDECLWFRYDYKPVVENGPRRKWSEDLVFCADCYRANVPILVDTSIICGHELRGVEVFPKDEGSFQISTGLNFDLVVQPERRDK